MTTQYCKSEHADTSTVGDRIVVFDRESMKSLVLNPSGARVWEMLGECQTADEIAARLMARFTDLPMEKATDDVHKYLSELVEQGVVVVRE